MSGTYSSGTYTETYQFVGEFVDRVTAPADQASVSLDHLGSSAVDMSAQLKAATDSVSAGLGKLEASANNASSRGFNTLQRSIDPLGASLRRAEADLTKLNARIAAGGSELDKYNALLPIATAKVEALRKQHEQYNTTSGQATTQNKALGFAMRDLSTQSIDLFTQLATGQNVFRSLIQQGSQVVQVNKQMGVGFGEMAAAVGARLLNPLTLAVAAVAALGAAFVAAGVHSESLDRQLSTIGNSLRGTRADFQGLSEDVVAAGRSVSRAMDTARADSTAAVQAIAAAPGWGGTREQLEHLGVVATQMSRVLGGTAVDNAKLLGKSFLEAGDVAKDLADKHLTGLTATLENQIQTMQRSGKTAEGFAALLKVVEDAVRGVEQPATDIQAAIKELDKAFQDATGSGATLAEGIGQAFQSAAATAIQMVAETIKAIGDLVSYVQSIPSKLGNLGSQLGALIPQGISRGVRQFISGSTETPPLAPQAQLGGENYRAGDELFGPPEIFGPSQPSASVIASGARYQQTLRQAYNTAGPKKDIEDITAELNKMREAKKLATDTKEVTAFDNAIFDLNKKLEAAIKATQGHKDASEDLAAALDRAAQKTNLQADQLIAVAKAADQGGAAVNQLNAAYKAQEDILSKDTRKLSADQIAEAIDKQTQANLRLVDAQNQAAVQREAKSNENQVQVIEAETAAIGKNAVERTTIIEQLKIEQDLKQKGISTESEYGQRLLQSAADLARVREENRLAQASFDELGNFVDTAMNQISQAISNAFLSGQGAAVSFRNVVKSIIAEIVQELIKLAILNPLRNFLGLGAAQPDLFSVLGAIGGGGGGGAASGGGGLGGLQQIGGAAYQGYNLFNGNGIFGGLGRLWDGISPNFGNAGIFSPGGIGGNLGPVTSFFQGGLFGTSAIEAQSLGTNLALSNLAGEGVGFGPATLSDVAATGISQSGTGILGGASIGGLATGVLAGFGAGSLAGGLIQGALGKTGPGPMIGAGAGAAAGAAIGSAFFGIGAIPGAIIGGLIGGGGGGLIGPKPASPYQATFVGIGANGQLSVDPRLSGNQLSPSNLQAIQNEVGAFNQNLNTLGVQVLGVRNPPPAGYAGGLGFFGQAKNPAGLAGQSVTDVFSNLKFGAQAGVFGADETDVLNRYINNKTFQTFTDLGQAVDKVRTFMERTLPAMRKYGENVGSLQQAIDQIAAAFDPAIATAHDLGYAEEELTTKREQQIAKAQQQAEQQFKDIDAGLNARYISATASSPFDQLNANVTNFDIQAQQQRTQLSDQLKAVYGDAVTETEGFGLHMASLERTLGAERLAILKQFDEAYVATLRQAADTVNALAVRQIQAGAALSDNRLGSLLASLTAFDIAADQQRRQLQATFTGLFGALGLQTKEYAESAVRLDVSLAQERLAIQRQFSAKYEAAVQQTRDIEISLALRQQQASATLSGDPAQILNANLAAFDAQAQQQRAQLRDQFQAMYGDVYTQLIDFSVSSAALEKTLGLERLAVQKQANDAIVADQKAAMDRARQSATGLVTQLTDYSRNLQYGGQSPLSPLQQLDAAQKEFNAVSGAARAGNAESYAKLSSYSDTLLNAGRAVYGSGEGYANLFRLVTDTLGQVAAVPEDTLTASVYALETRTQTQTLVDAIAALRSEVAGLRAQVAAGSAMPDRLAA